MNVSHDDELYHHLFYMNLYEPLWINLNLGVILDPQLKLGPHIHSVTKKIAQILRIFYGIRRVFNIECLEIIHNSHVYPSLMYCGSVLPGSKNLLNPICVLQKNTVHIVYETPRRAHTGEFFHEKSSLKFEMCHTI